MSDHIADKAGFLAALAMDDPERALAEQHARSCPACREALEEGQRLVALLAEALPLAPPTPELLARAATAIEIEDRLQPSGQGAERDRPSLRWAAAGAVMLVWILQLAYGKKIAHDVQSVTISLSVLVLALLGVTLARAQQRTFVGAMLVASGLFALAVGRGAAALEPRAGFECTLCELVAAVIPWLVIMVLAWRSRTPLERVTTMAVAGAGALASQAAQLLSCPVRHANPHLLVFHFGGVLLAMALGALSFRAPPTVVGASTT